MNTYGFVYIYYKIRKIHILQNTQKILLRTSNAHKEKLYIPRRKHVICVYIFYSCIYGTAHSNWLRICGFTVSCHYRGSLQVEKKRLLSSGGESVYSVQSLARHKKMRGKDELSLQKSSVTTGLIDHEKEYVDAQGSKENTD